MKNFIHILIIGLMLLLCASCKNQRPSPRYQPWDHKCEATLSGDKVCVPFKRTMSGLIEVQVSLNSVPFNMCWDTGAAITSISSLEYAKLVKEGVACDDDLSDCITITCADGSSSDQRTLIIKEIYIQGKDGHYLRLMNVEAIILDNTKAPLLLGQNVISNLPKHSFNESSMEIEFEK